MSGDLREYNVFYKKMLVGTNATSRKELVNNIGAIDNHLRLSIVTKLLTIATLVAIFILTLIYIL